MSDLVAIAYPDRATVEELKARYRAGRVGDVEVKEELVGALHRFLDPVRERRARFEGQRGLVDELIVEGTERTRAEVRRTLVEVRRAMGLTSAYTQVRRRAERYRKAVGTPA